MEQGPTTTMRRSSWPCNTREISRRLRSTSSVPTSCAGSHSCSSAGVIRGRTARMRVSSMRVVSWVDSGTAAGVCVMGEFSPMALAPRQGCPAGDTPRHQSGTMRVPASPIHMDNSAESAPDRSLDMMKRSIVQTALKLAEDAGSWDAVHVHAIAREAGISLEELRRYFGDKDAIAEGYFDIADAALLAVSKEPGWG